LCKSLSYPRSTEPFRISSGECGQLRFDFCTVGNKTGYLVKEGKKSRTRAYFFRWHKISGFDD